MGSVSRNPLQIMLNVGQVDRVGRLAQMDELAAIPENPRSIPGRGERSGGFDTLRLQPAKNGHMRRVGFMLKPFVDNYAPVLPISPGSPRPVQLRAIVAREVMHVVLVIK